MTESGAQSVMTISLRKMQVLSARCSQECMYSFFVYTCILTCAPDILSEADIVASLYVCRCVCLSARI